MAAAVAGVDYVVPAGNVATATRLQTARTINGASFTGAANITFGTLYPTAIPASANLNSYTQSGMYYCAANATVATLTNCPTTNAFFMLVGRHAGAFQMLVEYTTGSTTKIYYRNFYNTAWGTWKRIFTTTDPPTPAEIGAVAPSDLVSITNDEIDTLMG
ncbi:pyocin knob domain-containing protein [Eubacteriales bacterium OttesenSCG-928-K08]|nr:pyocin knob domain-containing protein [Eubacteriales bacterium OttesenSCG-928-K08]